MFKSNHLLVTSHIPNALNRRFKSHLQLGFAHHQCIESLPRSALGVNDYALHKFTL